MMISKKDNEDRKTILCHELKNHVPFSCMYIGILPYAFFIECSTPSKISGVIGSYNNELIRGKYFIFLKK